MSVRHSATRVLLSFREVVCSIIIISVIEYRMAHLCICSPVHGMGVVVSRRISGSIFVSCGGILHKTGE